jgi:hypothetical protein
LMGFGNRLGETDEIDHHRGLRRSSVCALHILVKTKMVQCQSIAKKKLP